MKKYLSVLLMAALLLCTLGVSGCSKSTSEDTNYVKDKGTLTVGLIEAPPMAYLNDAEEWVGFSIDLVRDFAKRLGVEVEFKEIDWTKKDQVLNEKTVDCIASAMTLTADRRAVMGCTNAYVNNSQIIVTKANHVRKYASAEDLLQAKVAVMNGSTHEELAKENGFVILVKDTNEEVLAAVSDGAADAAMVNSIYATTAIGAGNDFPDLARAFRMKDNKIGFAFRKDSDLTKRMNDYLVTVYTSGQMKKMAQQYNLEKLIVEQVTET